METVQNQLSKEVKKSIVKIESDLNELSKITDSAMRMRIGLRSGLKDLNDLKNSSIIEYLKTRAENIYRDICYDYNRIAEARFREIYPDTVKPDAIKPIVIGFDAIEATIPNMVKIIQTENNLNSVATAFIIFRRKTGIQFKMFDIQEVNEWWSVNQDKYINDI